MLAYEQTNETEQKIQKWTKLNLKISNLNQWEKMH